MGTPAKHSIKINWSSNLAYAIGLIASDGSLAKGTYRINFGSKDLEMMENFRTALGLENKIGKHARGGEVEKRFYYLSFKSKLFYDFLLSIGLMPAKSKIIQDLIVPDGFFADFLRGLFDGDGSFYSFRDIRWPNSFCYKTSFASASPNFIAWLKNKLTELYNVRGYLHKGAGVINLEYTKTDTKKIFEAMYHGPDVLFLRRKYDKMKSAFEYDAKLHPASSKHAAVA
ncbi:MAG TPA: hypothetical protein VMU07_00165 [Candidatus Paceibacterota bacterium]|nr:hypothetical protein [Candidatus Paceibacterota bacterium]